MKFDPKNCVDAAELPFIYHSSFLRKGMKWDDPIPLHLHGAGKGNHLEDEKTRELARQMHYAGYRAGKARKKTEIQKWRDRYFEARNAIVIGNRNLIWKVVRKYLRAQQYAEDVAGECNFILMRAAALYDPWKGIRFSTYSFTSLARAVCRRSKQLQSERISFADRLDLVPSRTFIENGDEQVRVGELSRFLDGVSSLLSRLERKVVALRFFHERGIRRPSLELIGRKLGHSKQEVRLLQKSALSKLREAISRPSCLA